MNLRIKNKIYTWVISVLLVLVLAVALSTFYFFMIQTSFGLNVSSARDERNGLVQINCFPLDNDANMSRDIMIDFLDKDIKIKDYVMIIPFENVYLYNNNKWEVSPYEFDFTSDNSISIFKPKIIEGSLKFNKRITKEKLKVKDIDVLHKDSLGTASQSIGKKKKYITKTIKMEVYGAIIPRSMAEKLFGENVHALGKEIYWSDGLNYFSEKVVCVYEDFPEYLGLKNIVYLSMNDDILSFVNYNFFNICFDIKKNKHIKSFNDDERLFFENLRTRIRSHFDNMIGQDRETIMLLDVNNPSGNYYQRSESDSAVYNEATNTFTVFVKKIIKPFDFTVSKFNEYDFHIDQSNWSNTKVSATFMFLALAVLLTAIICILNISLTGAPLEMKNINIRMVLGTSNRKIWITQIFKYILISFFAFVLMLFIIIRVDMDSTLDWCKYTSISLDHNVTVVLITLFIALMIGLITGLCNSYYVTSLPIDRVLKAKVGMDLRSKKWREIMLRVQFVLAFIPIILTQSLIPNNEYIVNLYNQHKLYVFFAVSNIFVVFVTLLCMIMQQERYMFRSLAIRKVLGTTDFELLVMNILHYSKIMLQVIVPLILLVDGFNIYLSYNSYVNYSMLNTLPVWAFYILKIIDIIIINVFLFVEMELLVIIPIVINKFISKNKDLSNALKSE